MGRCSPAQLLILLPTLAQAAMLDDFEAGLQRGNGPALIEGWFIYTDEGDQGSIDQDCTQGAEGTRCSLKVTVTSGDIYLYYLIVDRTLPQAQGANRMRFFIKFAHDYPVNASEEWPYHYLEVGTFPHGNGSEHYYHFINNLGTGDWQEVILTNNPSLKRESPGEDWPLIPDYYDAFGRFYIEGVWQEPSLPTTVWIDQVEFYHEEERRSCEAPGEGYSFNGMCCLPDEACTNGPMATFATCPEGSCCIGGGCSPIPGSEADAGMEPDAAVVTVSDGGLDVPSPQDRPPLPVEGPLVGGAEPHVTIVESGCAFIP